MKVGKARYGGGKKVFKIKDGDNVFRILPPLGKLADLGQWAKYYRVEWGYKNFKNENRPFQDVRVVNRETQMVEVESAAHLRREELNKRKNELVIAFRNKQATQDELKEAIDLTKQYNLDCKWYLNVVNLQGEIGLLKLGHKAKLSLNAEIEKLRKRGIDPLSIQNGRFFNFFRNNPGTNFRDITTTVTVYSENVEAVINGQKAVVQSEKVHVMDDTFIHRLSDETFDLSDMYPVITPEQVEMIVLEGTPAVDKILGFKNSNLGIEETDETEKTDTPYITQDTEILAKIQPNNTVKVSSETPKPVVATPTPINVVNTPTPPAPLTTVTNTQMSDEEFLKSIGAIE